MKCDSCNADITYEGTANERGQYCSLKCSRAQQLDLFVMAS